MGIYQENKTVFRTKTVILDEIELLGKNPFRQFPQNGPISPKTELVWDLSDEIKFFFHFTTFWLFNQTKEDICNKNRTVFNSNHKKMIDHFFI